MFVARRIGREIFAENVPKHVVHRIVHFFGNAARTSRSIDDLSIAMMVLPSLFILGQLQLEILVENDFMCELEVLRVSIGLHQLIVVDKSRRRG